MDKAIKAYHLNARGPMYSHYLKRLKTECTNIWQNGRQLCEAISLTGQSCVYELHRLPGDPVEQPEAGEEDKPALSLEKEGVEQSEEKSNPSKQSSGRTSNKKFSRQSRHLNKSLTVNVSERTSSMDSKKSSDDNKTSSRSRSVSNTVMSQKQHSSSIVTRAASNCGEFQSERKDPFSLIDANFTFYNDFASLEIISKKVLVKYEFSVFKPATKSEQQTLSSLTDTLSELNLSQSESHKDLEKKKNSNELKNFNTIEVSQDLKSVSPWATNQVQSQSATTNVALPVFTEMCLSDMLHSESPPGCLPSFNSWSLVSIGKFSDYNPHNGKQKDWFILS